MKTFKLLSTLSLLIAVSGCATYEPVPKEYSGPTATLKDSGFAESQAKGQLFAATEIDGNRISNAFSASASASHGQGFLLTIIRPERKITTAPIKVMLRGGHVTGAPFHAMASQLAGTFFSVSGVVDFTPEPGGIYVVKGNLKKEKSSVWIEEKITKKVVTTVVSTTDSQATP